MTHMEKGEITLIEVVGAVLRALRLGGDKLRNGDGRTNTRVAHARQLICSIARSVTTASWAEIGHAAGYASSNRRNTIDRAIRAAQACGEDTHKLGQRTAILWELSRGTLRAFPDRDANGERLP